MNNEKRINELNELTSKFNKTFSSLTPEQLRWKPNPKSWSITQVVEHIIKTNEAYFPCIRETLNGNTPKTFLINFPFLAKFFGNLLLKFVDPENVKKIKTFSIFAPSNSELDVSIFEKLTANNSELINIITSSKNSLENGALISSPASSHIFYNMETAFDILIAHEKRHFNQAKKVLNSLN